jgi:hypothetical protein
LVTRGLVDGRRPPFVWTTVASIKAVREGIAASDPSLSSLRSVYDALIEVANEQRSRPEVGGDSESFTATRERVATYSGTSTKTVSRGLKALERIGVLHIERREDRQLPNVYMLVEPGCTPPGSQSPPPGSQSPGDPGSQSPTTTQEEKKTTKKKPPVKTVNKKAVTDAELALAAAVVSDFNEIAGTALSVDAHLTPIVGRIREKPKLEAKHHRMVIEAVFEGEHWWDAPGPRIIYGNAAQFETSIEMARARSKKKKGTVDVNAEAARIRREQGLDE